MQVLQFWSLVAVLSFWCWVAAVGLLIARAFPSGRHFQGSQALVWGGLGLLFAAIWVYGLPKA